MNRSCSRSFFTIAPAHARFLLGINDTALAISATFFVRIAGHTNDDGCATRQNGFARIFDNAARRFSLFPIFLFVAVSAAAGTARATDYPDDVVIENNGQAIVVTAGDSDTMQQDLTVSNNTKEPLIKSHLPHFSSLKFAERRKNESFD